MFLKRILQHAIILSFLAIMLLAFFLTMFHAEFPLMPVFLRPVVLFSYGMMAPYQGYERLNAALMADGLNAAGEWEPIDLDPYFPVLRGERKVREYFMIYENGNQPNDVTAHAKNVAASLLTLERDRGHAYQSIRLSWDQWQPSPLGFNVLHHDPDMFSRVLITYP